MDFAININEGFRFASDEVKQDVVLVLKNPTGTFLQDINKGISAGIHTEEPGWEGAIAESLQKVKNCTVVSVKDKGAAIALILNIRNSNEVVEVPKNG